MYNLLGYSDNYSRTSEHLFRYYKDKPAKKIMKSNNGIIAYFADINTTDLFKLTKAAGQTFDNGTKDIAIAVPLKYPSNLKRKFQKALTNCEVKVILVCSAIYIYLYFCKCNIFSND